MWFSTQHIKLDLIKTSFIQTTAYTKFLGKGELVLLTPVMLVGPVKSEANAQQKPQPNKHQFQSTDALLDTNYHNFPYSI